MSTLYRALIGYAADSLDLAKPYHQQTMFAWQLDLDAAGRPVTGKLTPLTHDQIDKRTGEVITKAGAGHVTPTIKRTRGVSPILAADGIGYVLGWVDEKADPGWVASCHQAFIDLTARWAASQEGSIDPVAQAVHRFYQDGHTADVTHPDVWGSKDNVLLAVNGFNAYLAPSVPAFWSRHVETNKSGGKSGTCLVCGRFSQLVDTFPQMVKGGYAPGGQSSGVAPISINEDAYGFGLKKGLGQVPVCTECARAIPAALNQLLSSTQHTSRGTDSTSTWWVTGGADLDPFAFLDQAAPADVRNLISSVEKGSRWPTEAVDPDRFYALTLAGNAARMVVRGWHDVPVTELKCNIANWFQDTETTPLFPDGHRYLPLWRLARATGRFDRDAGGYLSVGRPGGRHPHDITADLRATAFTGTPPPASLLPHLIQRIGSDHRIDDDRAALLRLAMTRNPRSKETVMPGLDPDNTEPCYVAGRLFAHYEQIQLTYARADGGAAPNATFADKHLAGALADPRTALAAGERQAAGWLARLRRSGKDYYLRRDLDDLVALLDASNPLPARASLDQQAMFVLGYHHQRAYVAHARVEAAASRAAGKPAAVDTPDLAV